jgi:tetratricopeptide (TPR) repeat protein
MKPPDNRRPQRTNSISLSLAPGRPQQKVGVVDLANQIEQCVVAGQIERALFYVEQAIEQAPDEFLVWQLAVRVYDAAKYPKKTLAYCHKVLNKAPGHLPVVLSQMRALRSLDRYDEALAVAQRALPQHRDETQFQSALGILYKDLGQKDEALQHLNRAIALAPTLGAPYWNRAELIRSELPDAELAQMEKLCADPKMSVHEQAPLRFAVAAAYRYRSATIENINKEMEHLQVGNQLARSRTAYSLKDDLSMSERVVDITSTEFLGERKNNNVRGRYRPLFIVGMPRCGSTLVEQILFSHPQVATIGESNAFSQVLIESLRPPQNDGSKLFDNVQSVDFASTGEQYLKHVNHKLGDLTTFVDKQLLNFVNVGFIRLSFPNARIIHVKRNPLATCLSCYQHLFSARSVGFVYNLDDLAEKYISYQQTMDHWDRQFGDAVFTLEYERLIENQESVTRDLLEYCELPWEKNCLEYSQAARAIRTASNIQVRQGIYDDALNRWRAYEDHLQPLADKLGVV